MRRGASWLYSTLHVIEEPSSFSSLTMAPTASPAMRGTHTLFTSSRSRALKPMHAMALVKHNAFVSCGGTGDSTKGVQLTDPLNRSVRAHTHTHIGREKE